jgi:hypothetical protein
MDKTSVFFGMTDREMALLVAAEMRRRELYGCLFLFPSVGGPSVFVSSTPEGSMTGLTASEQLDIFAEVASKAVSEKPAKTVNDDGTPDSKGWVN